MRVGLDVSPLDQTRAGTARYIEGIDAIEGIELVRLGHRGSGRLATVYRDAWWYPVALPRLARRERLDVLHCPTFRGPISPPPMPLVVTVHDLAVLRHPEAFNLWTRRYSRSCVPRVVRAASRIIAVSEFTKRELVELLGTPPEKVTRHPERRGRRLLARRAGGRGRLRAERWARSSRARTSSASQEAARLAGAELRVVGARGWGGVEAVGAGWARSPTTSSRVSTAARNASSTRRCTRASACRSLEAMACGTPVVTSRGRRDGGDGRRRRGARRPVRPGCDRRGHRRSGGAPRRAAPPRPRARARVLVGRAAARRRRTSTGRRPSEPRRHRRGRARTPPDGRRDVRPQPPARICPRRRATGSASRRSRGVPSSSPTVSRPCTCRPASRSCGWRGRCHALLRRPAPGARPLPARAAARAARARPSSRSTTSPSSAILR